MAAFLDNPNFSIWSSLEIFLLMCKQAWCENKLHNGQSQKMSGFKHFYHKKKAAVIFNFCLIVKSHHNFLVPRVFESAPKTFMPIQTQNDLPLHNGFEFFFEGALFFECMGI